MSATNKDLVGTVTLPTLVADAFLPNSLVGYGTCLALGAAGAPQDLVGQIVYYPVASAGQKNPRIDIPPDPGV